MKVIKSLIGGLAGAIVLNIIHETVRRLDKDAPRIDLIGEESIAKGMKALGASPPKGKNLYLATLGADLVSNAIYYSLIGGGERKQLIIRGIGFGAAAGIGALELTKPMGLNDKPVNRTDKTKLLTITWYTIGGIATAFTIMALLKKSV